MSLTYGFAKSKVVRINGLKSAKHKNAADHVTETQYHLHATLDVGGANWDVAINVGTNDADDLVKYKLVYDFRHPVTDTLKAAPAGFNDLTDKDALPALDFVRSDVLSGTGAWRLSDVMDGSDTAEPAPSLQRLLDRARSGKLDVYVFGRSYVEGNGIHDTHMNQGSSGSHFLHTAGDDGNDHNDIWQDGAVLVDLGEETGWAAYFAAFEQQMVPTDDLGNPVPGAQPIG